MSNAVVLLSGGIDSAVCAALAKQNHEKVYAISFEYGQKQRAELTAAAITAKQLQVQQHETIQLSLDRLVHSALIDSDIDVPDYAVTGEIPSTYVPARNSVFLSIALGWAEMLEAFDIYYGANVTDHTGYPDCRPEYIQAFQTMANLATKAGTTGQQFTIQTPLVNHSKAQIIKLAMELGLQLEHMVSCYQADHQGRACGHCDSCGLRRDGFSELGIPDPTIYAQFNIES